LNKPHWHFEYDKVIEMIDTIFDRGNIHNKNQKVAVEYNNFLPAGEFDTQKDACFLSSTLSGFVALRMGGGGVAPRCAAYSQQPRTRADKSARRRAQWFWRLCHALLRRGRR